MSRFYKISIGGISLSDDGTDSGTPCKLQVAGVDVLRQTLTGNISIAADGTPVLQTFDFTKGKPLEIRVETLPKTVLDSLVTLINSALSNNSTIPLVGTGDAGDFTENCIPALPQPYSFSEFINGRIKNVTFRFMTT